MKELPVGIQYFDIIRKEDYIYVDKTRHIYDLLSHGRGFGYFISRPRRFGKSLLISTLHEIFLGNKQLFEGLWMSTSNYSWQKHPVIILDFPTVSGRTVEEFKTSFDATLNRIGKIHDVDLAGMPTIGEKLKELVYELAGDRGIVLLIDEYDRPLLNMVNAIDEMRKVQAVLSDFYAIVKALGNKISFLFITGITKFSKTSIFSGMNNLIDLTLLPSAAELLGYTENEIDHYFEPHIQEIAREQMCSIEDIKDGMRHWYNGYQFSKISARVYNPFSTLMYLRNKELRNYWFESGTPSFLVMLMREKKYRVEDVEHVEINAEDLASFDIDKMKFRPLLLQTGYLTIKSYDLKTQNYQLSYPNEETKLSFLLYFMEEITDIGTDITKNKILSLTRNLESGDLDQFFAILKIFFASIPYGTRFAKEQYYQSIFYVILSLLGAYVQVEVRTNNGRIDCIAITDKHIYIFEFKLKGTDKEALEQIEQEKYYERFLHDNKSIVLVGVAFDANERNIRSWLHRSLV